MEDIEILADITNSGDELQGVDNDLVNLLALLCDIYNKYSQLVCILQVKPSS